MLQYLRLALRRWSTRPMAYPMLMAILVAAVGAHVACVAKIPSWANDEPAHLGYVATLATGELPTIDSPTRDDPARFGSMAGAMEGWDRPHNEIWTANHAPLYHLLLVPLWWLSDGDPNSLFIAMRLLNTLGFATWVLMVALVARELAPRRPAVPALAAVLSVTPTLAIRAGYLQSDGFSSTAALLVILMTVRMLRGEVTSTRLWLAALGGVAAAGTRATGVLAVAVCTIVLAVVVLRRYGARRTLLAGAVVGGVPALATGWFYLRNLWLYGDLTGQAALLRKFRREPVDELRDIAGISGLWEIVQVTALPLLALAVLVATRGPELWRRRGLRVDPVWVLLAVHAALTGVNIVGFLADGGGFHDRYLMPVMPLLATGAAVGMLEAGRWWTAPQGVHPAELEWRLAAGWAALLLAWLAGAVWWLEDRHIYIPELPHPVTGPLAAVPLVPAVLAGLGVLAMFAHRAGWVAAPALTAGSSTPRPVPRPAGPR